MSQVTEAGSMRGWTSAVLAGAAADERGGLRGWTNLVGVRRTPTGRPSRTATALYPVGLVACRPFHWPKRPKIGMQSGRSRPGLAPDARCRGAMSMSGIAAQPRGSRRPPPLADRRIRVLPTTSSAAYPDRGERRGLIWYRMAPQTRKASSLWWAGISWRLPPIVPLRGNF